MGVRGRRTGAVGVWKFFSKKAGGPERSAAEPAPAAQDLRSLVAAAYEEGAPIDQGDLLAAVESGDREAMTVHGLALDGLHGQLWLRRAVEMGDPLALVVLGNRLADRGDTEQGFALLRRAEAEQGAVEARLRQVEWWTRLAALGQVRDVPAWTAAGVAAVSALGLTPAGWAAQRRRLVEDALSGVDAGELTRRMFAHPVYREADLLLNHLDAIVSPPQPGPEGWALLSASVRMDDPELTPGDRTAIGSFAAASGDLPSAHAWFESAARAGDRDAALYLAEVHSALHGPGSARELYRRAADAGHPVAQYNFGCQLAEAGDHLGAARYLRAAADAGHPEAPLNLGVSLRRLGDLDGAEASYLEAIARGQEADGWNNLGNLWQQRGDLGRAAGCWDTAAAGGSGPACASLGVLELEAGRLDRAEAFFRRGAAAGDPTAVQNLVQVLNMTGRAREAGRWIQTMLAGLDPGAPGPGAVPEAERPAGPAGRADAGAVADWLAGSAAGGDSAAREALRALREPAGDQDDTP